ncbi:MAG: AbrB/MazE/SpoVT family DNA-binding domain-containing protein [Acidobacteria bacterium]|nr:AbrB/MazE/SpoVT family DNA-binding domain-containing protein [Acidobacteriota bacterium]
MRITTKGQVTIPLDIRHQLGLLPHSEVEFDVVGDSVRIRKKKGTKSRGERLLEIMRRGPKPKPGMTTDQLMALTRGDD